MKNRTLEEHRARIQNLNDAERDVKRCARRTRVRDYLPGYCTYYLGDYPAKYGIEPTEYDFAMLKDLAEHGVEMIKLHEDWNDSIRRYGADKYSCPDPRGLQHFVDLCHYFGIKVIPYISSGYLHVFDPDFDEKFSPHAERYCEVGMYFKYRCCSAGSAEWRSFILPKTFAVLDKYGFDGIYNDWGTVSSYTDSPHKLTREGIPLTDPSGVIGEVSDSRLAYYDPEIEDLLCLIYGEVKKRGGIYQLHCDRMNPAPCVDKVYDYLWIGECVKDMPIGGTKMYPNYIIPCPDMARFPEDNLELPFLKAIPFLQFPALLRGRHNMGTQMEQDVPRYGEEIFGGDAEFLRRVVAYMQEHPNGPYVYSLWSSLGRDDEYYEVWKKYIKLYKPMVEEESVAYIDLREYDGIVSKLPEQVFASLFVNESNYLVAANFTGAPYSLELKETWTDRQTGAAGKTFTIAPESAVFLRK